MKNPYYKELNSFEDCCKAKGCYAEKVVNIDLSNYPEELRDTLIGEAQMLIITAAINGDWEPDYNNRSQWKHYPVFDMETSKNNPSGFALYDVNACAAYADAGLGSRHVFETAEQAQHAGTVFIDIYRKICKR